MLAKLAQMSRLEIVDWLNFIYLTRRYSYANFLCEEAHTLFVRISIIFSNSLLNAYSIRNSLENNINIIYVDTDIFIRSIHSLCIHYAIEVKQRDTLDE